MIHPHTELRFISDKIGYGVVATRLIPAGTITWTRDDLDQSYIPGRVKEMSALYGPILEKYCFVDAAGNHILCWDIARFVNHACEAACLSAGYDFELAVRDIHPGDELTDDYGTLNIEAGFTCHCGSPRCRKFIHPDDALVCTEGWDAQVRKVFGRVEHVEQPLWTWVKEKEQIGKILAKHIQIPSSIMNYHSARQNGHTPLAGTPGAAC